MGAISNAVKKVTGEEAKRKAEELARKAEAEKVKRQNQLNEEMRRGGEVQASAQRARRRSGGLLETASVVGGEQTLGSGTAL
jgi:hypothetical protein